jgi:hypothetical protein
MTRHPGWRGVLAVLAVLAPACPAAAADAPPAAEGAATTPPAAEKCPDVYGVWETEYAVGRFGVEDVGPWYSGLLVRAIIGREKTGLVWMKEKFPESKDGKFHPSTYTSSVFRRDRSMKQGDDYFFGRNAGEVEVSARIIDGRWLRFYPEHRCMLTVATVYPRRGGGYNLGPRVIMTKVK